VESGKGPSVLVDRSHLSVSKTVDCLSDTFFGINSSNIPFARWSLEKNFRLFVDRPLNVELFFRDCPFVCWFMYWALLGSWAISLILSERTDFDTRFAHLRSICVQGFLVPHPMT
jgi:hypothetical protein